ncbi:MAG: hypothetical protein ABIL86_02805 [candidate division WOR-3 bacterium]
MDNYYLLGKISPKLRNFLTVVLFFVGYVLQLSSRNILVGLPFFIFCLLLNLIRNFTIKPIRAQKLEWKEVTPERIEQVYNHCQRLSNISGGATGCVVFFLIVFFLIFFAPVLLEIFSEIAHIGDSFPIMALIVDSSILFSGVLLSGRRSVWIPNNLDVKIPIIRRILKHPVFSKDPNIKIIPYLEIGTTEQGQFPNDTRILIKFLGAPPEFIGVQFQISINDVQGKKYPYCYCVIIARKSFGLFGKFKPLELARITMETERSSDADVIIIRQTTTRNTGYYTDKSAQDYILNSSIAIAKRLILTHFHKQLVGMLSADNMR